MKTMGVKCFAREHHDCMFINRKSFLLIRKCWFSLNILLIVLYNYNDLFSSKSYLLVCVIPDSGRVLQAFQKRAMLFRMPEMNYHDQSLIIRTCTIIIDTTALQYPVTRAFTFFENDVDCLVQMSNKWKHVALLVSFWKESFIRVCFMFRIFLYNANHTNCINMFTKRLPLLLRVMRESKYCVYFQINLMPVAISLTLLTQIIYTLYFLCVLKLICKLLNECGKLTFFCCVKSML